MPQESQISRGVISSPGSVWKVHMALLDVTPHSKDNLVGESILDQLQDPFLCSEVCI